MRNRFRFRIADFELRIFVSTNYKSIRISQFEIRNLYLSQVHGLENPCRGVFTCLLQQPLTINTADCAAGRWPNNNWTFASSVLIASAGGDHFGSYGLENNEFEHEVVVRSSHRIE